MIIRIWFTVIKNNDTRTVCCQYLKYYTIVETIEYNTPLPTNIKKR